MLWHFVNSATCVDYPWVAQSDVKNSFVATRGSQKTHHRAFDKVGYLRIILISILFILHKIYTLAPH